MILRRRGHRQYYKRLFADVPGVSVFGGETDTDDNFWLTSVLVEAEAAGFEATALSSALTARGIESRPLWKPMHLQPVFRHARRLTNGTSQHLFETGLTLPSGSAMAASSLELIGSTVTKFLEENR
jgi:dTDP-4-amino-4,6-dideoxygalactose transaminase